MRRTCTRVLFAMMLLALGGCAWVDIDLPLPSIKELATSKAKKKPTWQSPLLQQHHLVGRIWRPSDGRFVDEASMAEDLVRSAFVLLGEKHDNADHHQLQARLLSTMVKLGRRPAVVWEMIPEARQAVLNRFHSEHSRDAAALGVALGWDASGWPSWQIYQPIAQSALDANLPMYGAALSKKAIRALARSKPSFEFARRRRALGLHIPMPEELRQRSLEQLYQGHCELMPREALTPLLNVQQARDAVFAEHMLTSAINDGALLIAGDGHVRKDIGVPLYLARHQPNVRITSVAIVEVRDELLDPNDYAAGFSAPVMPYDYVWFTPRADNKDHCAKLREKWAKPAKQPKATAPKPPETPKPAPSKMEEKAAKPAETKAKEKSKDAPPVAKPKPPAAKKQEKPKRPIPPVPRSKPPKPAAKAKA